MTPVYELLIYFVRLFESVNLKNMIETTSGIGTSFFIQGVSNWYSHFQLVITQAQKLQQHGTIHEKKVKSRYAILRDNNIRKMITIISNIKCGNIQGHFHKLSATFLFEFYIFSACIQLFDINISGTGVENTFVFRCPRKKKSHGIRLRLHGGHGNAAPYAIRRSTNFYFRC